jgi:3-oxoacyl-[acyl-carrier protein] reductase
MDLGIKDNRVLITGGSKGIGVAIAKAFAEEGCKVSLVARDEDQLKKTVEELGTGHDYLDVDLLESGAPTKAAKELIERHGTFDIVVHNVGGGLGIKDPLASVEDWANVWNFNVGIAIEMNALLVPLMQKQKWGRIVNISSIAAVTGGPMVEPFGGSPQYAVAKSYLNSYTKVLGRELAKDNVVVTAVMPGAILSPGKHWEKLQKSDPKKVDEYLQHHLAAGRFGKAEEIAPFVVFLASELASFASGSVIPVDGGTL